MQTYPTGYAESHRIAEQIFREILPRHGMAVREEQIALCHEVLDTLYNKEISLCEAGVGTGNPPAFCNSAIQSMRAARRNGVSTNGSLTFLRSLENPCVQENDSVRNVVRSCLAKSL